MFCTSGKLLKLRKQEEASTLEKRVLTNEKAECVSKIIPKTGQSFPIF